MIGVFANPADMEIVREFFELFKTPWTVCKGGESYDAILSFSGEESHACTAPLVVRYTTSLEKNSHETPRAVRYRDGSLPLYRGLSTFGPRDSALAINPSDGAAVAYIERRGAQLAAHLGYDLLAEVRVLLTQGQPAEFASIPALDLHIDILRRILRESGVPFMEIPPIPEGFKFIACLTHDVDHPSLARHKFDSTMAGFVYRATVGSISEILRGRGSLRTIARNLWAICKLPFFYLGFAGDIWLDFVCYPSIERGHPSTFFVLPFAGRPGEAECGPAPKLRAAGYGAADIALQIQQIRSQGSEVELHGIDAWRDPAACRTEISEIRAVTGEAEIGVRMHWLYFDAQSPTVLEQGGASYDSTIGYNETVGYRAGTGQVFKLPNVSRLLELPMHIMDTALFYPSRANLSWKAAEAAANAIIRNAERAGGVVTINWHDRSISPERCWDGFYARLLKELEIRGAWFGTANQCVEWFRTRRSLDFRDLEEGKAIAGDGMPGWSVIRYNFPIQTAAVSGKETDKEVAQMG